MCASSDSSRVEPLRTIHHLACTGGTLIASCLASMPNVQLLGEMDPLSPLPLPLPLPPKSGARFSPTDMISHLRQGTRPVTRDLLVELFQAELRVVHAWCTRQGLRVILRDHSHSHFCTGPAVDDRPSLRALLPAELPALSVVTVRHPLDSFASLRLNRWVHFTPGTLDEYCRRQLAFLDHHATVPRLRYEDLIAEPQTSMERLCSVLDLAYEPGFLDVFAAFTLTGGSGRTANQLAVRTRRPEADALRAEAKASVAYRELLDLLGYS
jgi:hypothetical protein